MLCLRGFVLTAAAAAADKNDPRLKGVRQFQTQPQKRGQTAGNWGEKKYSHLPLFDVRARLLHRVALGVASLP